MSTLSSQYHAGGASLGRDVIEQAMGRGRKDSITGSRIGTVVAILMALIWAWVLPGSVIARATAFFFGLCAASFLPIYCLGLYWKGMTRAGAAASLVLGFCSSMFWLLFVHEKEAAAIGLSQALFGQATLVSSFAKGSWVWLLQFVDPNVVALPVSALAAVVVSLLTRKLDPDHVALCWRGLRAKSGEGL
jgi:SSS family solute:Na+ symporter